MKKAGGRRLLSIAGRIAPNRTDVFPVVVCQADRLKQAEGGGYSIADSAYAASAIRKPFRSSPAYS